MFKVCKVNNEKPQQDLINSTYIKKSKNIFTKLISSSKISKEKSKSPSNSISLNTNSSSDSGKNIIIKKMLHEKTNTNLTQKKNLLSRKIKFHVELVGKEKENQNLNELNERKLIKNNKTKNIKLFSLYHEYDIKEGRWNPDEHLRFIKAISIFGNDWKEIKNYVGSRSANQVRSHAQKFFLKLKTFKDDFLGIDFTIEDIKNLFEIVNKIKEYEKNNNCNNILLLINQKLLENNNFKNKYSFSEININENEAKNKNKNIIKNEDIIENDNNNIENQFFEEIKDNENLHNYIEICENENHIENNFEQNISKKEKNETKEKFENIIEDEQQYFTNTNKEINFIGEYLYDNINELDYGANDYFLSPFSNFIKESNTLSIINRNYFS